MSVSSNEYTSSLGVGGGGVGVEKGWGGGWGWSFLSVDKCFIFSTEVCSLRNLLSLPPVSVNCIPHPSMQVS